MGNSTETDKFKNLMKQLEFIVYKTNHKLVTPQKDCYYNIYINMDIDTLIYNVKIELTECNKYLEEILNSPNYSSGSLFKERDIDKLINKLIAWKEGCPKYKYFFEKAKQLFNRIQMKDLEISESNMEIEQTNNFANNSKDYNEMGQQLKLIDKQKEVQAQELALLNDNFGRALSSLECLANRLSGKQLSNVFNYYNIFNLGNTQSLAELQKKAFIQIQIFKLAYEDYISKYKYYITPENIGITDIKTLINKWMQHVPKEQMLMYQGMINIISSLDNKAFEQKFKSYTVQYKNAKMDPRKIASFAPGVYYYNHQRCEEARNSYLEKGKLISRLNINKNYKDDKKAEELQKYISTNNKNYQEADMFLDVK